MILAQLLLYAFFLGAGLGAVYDVICVTRVFLGVPFSKRTSHALASTRLPPLKCERRTKPSSLLGAVSFVEDLFFSLGAAILLILLFYQYNNGKIRVLAILCAVLGYGGYRILLGTVIRPLCEFFLLFSFRLSKLILFFFLFPFRRLARFIFELIRTLLRKRRCALEKRRRRQLTEREWTRIKSNACGMQEL